MKVLSIPLKSLLISTLSFFVLSIVFLIFLPLPVAFATVLDGRVVNMDSQYADCHDDNLYYYGGWDLNGKGWTGPVTSCQGPPKYMIKLCAADGSWCDPTVPKDSLPWTQNGFIYDEWDGPRFGKEVGENDFDAKIFPFWDANESKMAPDGMVLDRWEFQSTDNTTGWVGNRKTGRTLPAEINVQEPFYNGIWFYYKSQSVPTPPPQPVSCDIQQPNPPKTESPIVLYRLTDNYTTTASGTDQWVTVRVEWYWGGKIELADPNASKMTFSRQGADYLEGDFQDFSHRQTDLFNLRSADFNQYFGRVLKLAPNLMTDDKRVDYVNAVIDSSNTKLGLEEKLFKYTDIDGNDPYTIAELVGPPNNFGLPNPPPPEASQGDIENWLRGWGRYWEKIPLSTNDKSWGDLIPPSLTNDSCNIPQKLTVPDNYRLDNIAGDLNQILVPKEAQSPTTADSGQKAEVLAFNPSSVCSAESQKTTVAHNQTPVRLASANTKPTTGNVSAERYLAQSQSSSPAVLAASTPSCGGDNPPDWEGGPGNQICYNNWPGTSVVKYLTPDSTRDTDPEATVKSVYVPGVDCYCPPPGKPRECGRCPGSVSVTFTHFEDVGFKALLPYLEKIWNKSTYSEGPNPNPGFFNFFIPSVDGQVLTAQFDNKDYNFDQHAETPILLKFADTTNTAPPNNLTGDPGGTFVPKDQEGLFPKYMAGFNNAKNFIQNATWPGGAEQNAPCYSTSSVCNNGTEYNTYCDPNCTSSNRTCWESPSCSSDPTNCNDVGGDAYCNALSSGLCGPYGKEGCTPTRKCGTGGNCYTECSC